jgi:signal transduction histidine kinase
MRLSYQTRQALGVTCIVALTVIAMSVLYLAAQAQTLLAESELRGRMLANATYQRAFTLVRSRESAAADLQADPGLRAILLSAIGFAENVTYATITDVRDNALVHSSPTLEGTVVPTQQSLEQLLQGGPFTQLRGVWEQRSYEVTQPLLLGDEEFGSIRIGVSTVLIWAGLKDALKPIAWVSAAAIILATCVSWLMARRFLRPIHVLQSGIARLGQGEQDVRLDLPDEDFKDLGTSFNALSQSVSTIRSQLVEQARRAESVVERLEDAVAIVGTTGEVAFANTAMKALLPELEPGAEFASAVPAGHPCRVLVEQALAVRASRGPVIADLPAAAGEAGSQQQLMAHPVADQARGFVGVMLVARNVGALSQLQTMLRYSRKLASLNRLLAGVAHEVKNPLNAMTIHLELLRQKLGRRAAMPVGAATGAGAASGPPPAPADGLMSHVSIIGEEIRRLDHVVQGFLRFSRPEELQLEPVPVAALLQDIVDVVRPQAEQEGIAVEMEANSRVAIQVDRAMVRQALLNLALNAIEAMPSGGTLALRGRSVEDQQVQIDVVDTGIGIKPEHLGRVFDLYFTTREQGSGLGLSMVYRTVQLHDGTIEVESSPGHGATFRVRLPRA